jgi:hypothetical protein
MPFFPDGGVWSPFGGARRNQPVKLRPVNPLPENKMGSCTGDAGLDGYTALSCADRVTGERPSIDGRPQYWGPRNEEN